MKENRRDFLKALGLSSGALLMSPVSSAFAVQGDKASLLKAQDFNSSMYAQRKLETDILIAGGGMSGVCAALAAARNGAKVILIQDRSRLGGNASSEIRMHISGSSQLKQVWRETGILEELMLTESVTNPQASYEMQDYVLYDKVFSEPNITLLLDTAVYEISADDRRIHTVKAFCSQTEEVYEVSASFFTDCTGDGTLAALAGAEFMRGREAKKSFGESLGLEKADDITMGNSLLFEARMHDRPMPFKAPSWARKYTFKDFEHRKITSYEYGYWWIELGGVEDIVHDGQKIRDDLMAVVFGIWDYIKNSGDHPKSANWALSWFGMIPGKRESRRITGDYIMTQRDIQAPELLEDRVAYGGWPLDDHLPEGMDDTSQNPFRSIPLKGPYPIPLRSLYSKSFDNLYMAGRNISVSHVALSSTRVMATCATMGQAVGTAMAYCLKEELSPRDLFHNKEHLKRYQQILRRQDQSLLGIKNEDEQDLARKAKVSASEEDLDGEAAQVIDGFDRDVQDGKSHQWRAVMEENTPWVELRWSKMQQIGCIECTFDTGLDRFLRLSSEAVVQQKQIRGYQPETVSDLKIEVKRDSQVVYETFIKENYLRKFVHHFSVVQGDAVRVTVHKTHGHHQARIFEIRCYDQNS
ncbi:FAD-dependent oxidoreductase [Sphingobacterium haloxyli]|uniref:FAD-dependent oxidoreductase n=1 Tax=Sphingobacterium haloxyli TaxID=2100533 RepID=A0A2S9IY98_9SPHI|nr:FAD-dependent oxidoreductase [Sphingobacterium haloxyli]PRD45506.1 FAD-dependent oxidoreductase [Sphingobacterium haloxyli]